VAYGIIEDGGGEAGRQERGARADCRLQPVFLWSAANAKRAALGGLVTTSGHESFGGFLAGAGMDMTSASHAAYNSIAVASPGGAFVAVVRYTNLTTNSTGILLAGKTHYTNSNGFMFESKADENTIEINGGDGGSFPTMSVPGLGTIGQTNTIAVCYAGTSVSVALNGKFIGSVTIGVAAGTWPSGIGIGNYAGASTSSNDTSRIYYLAGIVRGGADLLVPLSRNPWQLFEPVNEPVFYSLGGGGATDYPVTATDALTLADSASQGFGATSVATDAATLADSAAAAMAATSAASDALTLADSASNVAALSAVASDALTLADTLNASTAGNYTATGTDALTLADSASNVAALSAVASDALTLADSASNVAALSATAGDALTLADTLNASATGDYVVASSDALTLADSAAAAFAAVCIATDAMTLADATSAALSGQYAATASDALTLADAASNAAALGVTITEALTLAALVSALNSGTPVLGVRGGFAVQRQLATRRAQIQTARRRN